MAVLNKGKFSNSRTKLRGQRPQTDAPTVARRTMAQTALRLRADGYTYAQIREKLDPEGQSTLTNYRLRELVEEEMNRQGKPSVDQLRDEMLEQADRLFNRAFQIAMKDTNRDRVAAMGMALKAQERIANLMGLDAPKQTEVKDTTPRVIAPATVEDVLAQLAEEARADLAKQGLEYDPATGITKPIEVGEG